MISIVSWGATAALVTAFILEAAAGFLPWEGRKGQTAPRLTGAAALLLIAAALLIGFLLIQRSLRWSFPALSSSYEALLLLTGLSALILGIFPWRRGKTGFFQCMNRQTGLIIQGGTVLILLLWILASSPLIPSGNHPPVPALQSGWLVLHISLTLAGEAFFLTAAVTSLLSVLPRRAITHRQSAEKLTYRLVTAGYPLYTAGALLFGAIWAYYAWGRFWGWDPKEVWALVTWLVYTLYLHQRLLEKRKTAWVKLLPLLGFLAALFTFLGVNYLMTGLHSY